MPDNARAFETTEYKEMVESSPDLICRLLPGGTLTFANEAFCRFFSIEADRVPERSLEDVLPAEGSAAFLKTMAALTPESPSESLRNTLYLPSGEKRYYHWAIRGHFTPEGKITAAHGFGRDVTDRVKATGCSRKVYNGKNSPQKSWRNTPSAGTGRISAG
jgi:PAS domain S-box-containing protein